MLKCSREWSFLNFGKGVCLDAKNRDKGEDPVHEGIYIFNPVMHIF